MNPNIYSIDGELIEAVWTDLYTAYIDSEIDKTDKNVIPLNYCGYTIKLEYFTDRNYSSVEKMFNEIPWLKPRIIFYETDPNLKISDANGDDKEYGSEFLDQYSIHLHRIEDAIAMMNTNATINFPLLNCNEGSITKWYKLKQGSVIDTGYLSRTDHAEVVEEASLRDRQCNLMRMDRWHSVNNYTGQRRVIANWDFSHYVTWDDAVELLVR